MLIMIDKALNYVQLLQKQLILCLHGYNYSIVLYLTENNNVTM